MKIMQCAIVFIFISVIVQSIIIEGPSNVTYIPGLTPLPIELTCNVTGVATWSVNDTSYTIGELTNGELPGHSRIGTNILVNSPVNNTEYICVSTTNDGDMSSDPAYIVIAGVPGIVPVDNNTSTSINGNNVTLILSWGEPYNLDPIVNYTVSCSGDATCPPSFTTTDNTTRSYTITDLTPMTNYTFSVVATNSIGSGEAGVVMITTPRDIMQVKGVNVICEEEDQPNVQCNAAWNPVTVGNITLYQVCYYVNVTVINITCKDVNSSINQLIFFVSTPPDGVFSNVVVVNVTAFNKFGNGPPSNAATEIIYGRIPSVTSVMARVSINVITNTTNTFNIMNVIAEVTLSMMENNNNTVDITDMSTVTTVTMSDLIFSNAPGIYNVTIICNLNSDSDADMCEVLAVADGGKNITGTGPVVNRMATVNITGLECGVTYTIIAGGTLNGSLVGPRSSHGNISTSLCTIIESMLNMILSNGDSDGGGCETGCVIGIVAGLLAGGGIVVGSAIGGRVIYKRSTKSNADVQPDKVEMHQSSDLYDSPKNKQLRGESASAAQEQSLYSYARSGPINVVMPGQGGQP